MDIRPVYKLRCDRRPQAVVSAVPASSPVISATLTRKAPKRNLGEIKRNSRGFNIHCLVHITRTQSRDTFRASTATSDAEIFIVNGRADPAPTFVDTKYELLYYASRVF